MCFCVSLLISRLVFEHIEHTKETVTVLLYDRLGQYVRTIVDSGMEHVRSGGWARDNV